MRRSKLKEVQKKKKPNKVSQAWPTVLKLHHGEKPNKMYAVSRILFFFVTPPRQLLMTC